MLKAKIRGSQGRWDADVQYSDGRQEVLPCVHSQFVVHRQNDGHSMEYLDQDLANYRHLPKWQKHFDLLRSAKRVVLTSNKVEQDRERGHGRFTRKGYVAVYNIDNLVADDQGLRFRFVERIANP